MSKSRKQIHQQLRDAEAAQMPVRIVRDRFDTWALYGFVVNVTEKWLAIQTLADGVYTDGYEAVRIKHIDRVKVDWTSDYIERALATLGRPDADFVIPDGAVTKDVLAAAAQHSTMFGVHFEREEGEPMWIGHLESLDDDQFSMWFINPNGDWEPETRSTPYRDVTRVQFGDRYSVALQRFGKRREQE